ncbi:MAG: IS256 family transposase [Chloroflexi bacterium]|nr:IS256 family transposase [Chloroflexota bacterium]
MSDGTQTALARLLSPLDELVREGARQLLQRALKLEVAEVLAQFDELRDDAGRHRVVRNGHLPGRTVLTGAGPLEVRQPRLRDRAGKEAPDRFQVTSAILPPYLRRSSAMDALIPWLYLKGISAADMSEALQPLIGTNNVSAAVVLKLKEEWERERQAWKQRDLAQEEYVSLWADGVYFTIRLDRDDRQCILVLIGATKDGRKELLAVQDGYRESEQSWHELLTDLKQQGLVIPPKLAVGDGALGFWAALRKVYPTTREQRCWMHKSGNVLDKLPKAVQPRAKDDLRQVWMAETRAAANAAFDLFLDKYGAKYPKATACLAKDRDELLAFYDFPAEHWKHLRTTNPIESTFATVRLRHRRTKGSGSREACLAMVFKLVRHAQRHWRKLDAHQLIPEVLAGRRFVDGIIDTTHRDAA